MRLIQKQLGRGKRKTQGLQAWGGLASASVSWGCWFVWTLSSKTQMVMLALVPSEQISNKMCMFAPTQLDLVMFYSVQSGRTGVDLRECSNYLDKQSSNLQTRFIRGSGLIES